MAADVASNNLELDLSLEQLHLLDADPVVGNVSRFLTGTPPKGNALPPKGQLIFDASFESGTARVSCFSPLSALQAIWAESI
jgi:hypothetical protein